jgi:hypothetical protein
MSVIKTLKNKFVINEINEIEQRCLYTVHANTPSWQNKINENKRNKAEQNKTK